MPACLRGFELKLIAVVAMIVDHIGMLMFQENMIFRIVGRISFPIFCFLIVEGFYHTKDVKRYVKRLALFAVLSEVPFDLLVSGKFIDIRYQNVFFTLFIGLLTIYAINSTINYMLKSAILAAGILVAMVLMTDYSFYGVILVYLFYNFREKRLFACILMGVASFLISTVQAAAILAAVPILMYNGQKGPKFADGKVWKYSFYAIYPIHMIILVMIA